MGFLSWLLRFVQGIFIGSGFLLPGVSGGALAAVFGLYPRLISWIAHPFRRFCSNFCFFLPVAFGGVCGIFLLAFVLHYLLTAWQMQILWFFIGCILGTVPFLWKQAGKKGRQTKHIILFAATALLSGFLLMVYAPNLRGAALPQHGMTWLFAGMIIGLGVLIPGLSPSNFLLYLGLYPLLTHSIQTLQLSVLVPVLVGMVGCILLFSRLMEALFAHAYIGISHVMLGLVLASTVMIIPTGEYTFFPLLLCVIACTLGLLLGRWMCQLEEVYVPLP